MALGVCYYMNRILALLIYSTCADGTSLSHAIGPLRDASGWLQYRYKESATAPSIGIDGGEPWDDEGHGDRSHQIQNHRTEASTDGQLY